jgi:hypothetical protein
VEAPGGLQRLDRQPYVQLVKEFFMVQGFSVVIYPVTDLAQAKTFYRTLLGIEPYTDEAY